MPGLNRSGAGALPHVFIVRGWTSDPGNWLLQAGIIPLERHGRGHIQGAALVVFTQWVSGTAPVPGKLSDIARLRNWFDCLGLRSGLQAVVVNHEVGGCVWILMPCCTERARPPFGRRARAATADAASSWPTLPLRARLSVGTGTMLDPDDGRTEAMETPYLKGNMDPSQVRAVPGRGGG